MSAVEMLSGPEPRQRSAPARWCTNCNTIIVRVWNDGRKFW